MDLKETIIELASIAGPAGSEEAVTERVKELLEPLMDEVRLDNLGNVIGYRSCGKKGAKRLLIDAHIDEIGLIVTGIEEGFLKFSTIGRVDPLILPARQVKILTDPPIYGVICSMPVHALTPAEMNKTTKPEDMYIDIGLNQEEAIKKVPLGTPIVPDARVASLQGDVLTGRALDNRACMAIIIDALSALKGKELNVDLIVMASVQEELGHRGAMTGAFSVAPDYVLVLDVTHAKTPDYKKEKALNIGGGAAIGVGPNMSRKLSDKLIAVSKEKGISYQIEPMGGSSGTNAWVIQTSREGVATAVVSLPLKYMHTPVETMKLSDANAISRLVSEFVLSMKGGELDAN